VTFLICHSFIAFSFSVFTQVIVDAFLSERISILGSTLGLERTENAGVAFGLSFPPLLQSFLIALALIVVCVLAYRIRSQKIPSIAFGLIIGGALANIVDRFDDGFVTDFIQVGWWPTFNVADSCITVGVAILLLWEVVARDDLSKIPNPKSQIPRKSQ
jgi:signal peptidase II